MAFALALLLAGMLFSREPHRTGSSALVRPLLKCHHLLCEVFFTPSPLHAICLSSFVCFPSTYYYLTSYQPAFCLFCIVCFTHLRVSSRRAEVLMTVFIATSSIPRTVPGTQRHSTDIASYLMKWSCQKEEGRARRRYPGNGHFINTIPAGLVSRKVWLI